MSRNIVCAVVGLVALAASLPAGAEAAPTRLTVTNLAQPGMESEVPQPPVSATARGTCDTPFSAQEANSGVSPCPPGSWPGPGGDWRPEVSVAGGDRLRLVFVTRVEQVRYAATTNYPPWLLNPVGQRHLNQDAVPAREAQPTDDPHVWTIDLPRFDATGHSPWGGYTFPGVARAGTDWRNFVLSIAAPRPMRYGRALCDFWSNPGDFFAGCLLPPGGPPINLAVPDRRPPALAVRIPAGQRALRRRGVVAYARCDERCSVGLSVRIRVGRRSYRLRYTRKAATAGRRIRMQARLTRRAVRALTSASGGQRRARAVVTLRARDVARNPSRLVRRTISLR